ncbi:MAG: spore coat protein [Clostridiaceae bacterium]|nr:spore coat protein [Clostridiaceae bacterium]
MDDKSLMEGMLLTVKNACDMYLHGVEEASTPEVRRVMQQALTETLEAQNRIYDSMAAKGWYPQQQAQSDQINQTRQKYQNQSLQ